MIEVGAAEILEEDMVAAIAFGQEAVLDICEMIEELREKAGVEKRMGNLNLPSDDVVKEVEKYAGKKLLKLRQIQGKHERGDAIRELRDQMLDELFQENQEGSVKEWLESKDRRAMAKEAFRTLEKKTARKLLLDKGIRADGRGADEIRPLDMQVGVLARTHGSAIFQRGETQSLVSCALGTARDEQIVDGLMPEYSKKFMLHYNFPPFCVGEARRIMGPSRREIGHGALAERSLAGVIPSAEDFPYTIRLISDITESNGSSSMASVCGGCLALMDAGVPIVDTCAGISVGWVHDEKKSVFITDIIGEEDFFGDMDFKVSGTREGITGIQLDLKARGLTVDQVEEIFEQARKGRIEIIDQMEAVIPEPREEMSMYAPRLISLKIDPEKIGRVIGPGGKVVRGMQEKYGVTIEVEDDGVVLVSGLNAENVMAAANEVEALGAEIKVGTIYEGTVVSVKDFGAFVELAPGTDGMCHVSELDTDYVKNVSDVVSVGDKIHVKVINVDEQGRIKLSRKAYLSELETAGAED
jgi:polyribonucleotide nucleotidyltransferase